MEQRSLTVTYTPLESGDAESRWLRIEQEKPDEDETISVAEAAAIIDSLYNIEPCDDGMGGGGEETDEDKEPEEEVVEEALAEMLRRAGVCHEEEYWTAVIRVYRSHKWPETYEIRSETATVESTEPVRESYRQDVEVSGAVIELDMPYDGALTGIPASVQWEVRGSTVNLDRPVNGHLRLRYDTRYERVTLRVPTDSGDTDPQAAIGVVGSGDAKRQRPELPSAAVAVFWGDLAASCELEPPEQDDEIPPEELARICDPKHGGGAILQPGSGCWKTIEHYARCLCSTRKVNTWEEDVEVDCGSEKSGTYLGKEETFGGYVWCEGEEDDNLQDPKYFERHCCRPPPNVALLPRCRRTYGPYNGGHAIENGAEHWTNIYGPDVVLIPVLPKDGRCGELVTEWNVPTRNCCDDVEPQEPSENNPRTILPGGSVKLVVKGGQNPRKWRASAGLTFRNGESYLQDGSHEEWVYASNDACEVGSVQVDDGCTKIHMPLTLEEGQREPMQISPDEATIGSGQLLVLKAYYTRGEVQWTPGSLRLVSGQGTSEATFEAPEGFCGQTEVTATDACGEMATALVLSTQGHWEEVSDFDPCSAPWAGRAPSYAIGHFCPKGGGYLYSVDNYQGYKATVCFSYSNGWMGSDSVNDCSNGVGGSCSAAVHPSAVCGYTGNEIIGDLDGSSLFSCDPIYDHANQRRCFPLCSEGFTCSARPVEGDFWRTEHWAAHSQAIEQLWRWECP